MPDFSFNRLKMGCYSGASYPNGDDVAGAVDDRQARIHQQLAHEFDIALVSTAQQLSLWAPQHPHWLQRPRQHHWWQRGSEDEAGGKGANRVHQGGGAGYVAPDTAKRLPCRQTVAKSLLAILKVIYEDF